MGQARSCTLKIRALGPLACFTRPELKVERVSYPVMTPSAARGLLEAVLWKPAILWHVERIHVLKDIKFTSFRRNELSTRAVSPTLSVVDEGGSFDHYFIEDDKHRAQRNTVALSDVDYIIEAHFTFTDKAGPDDNIRKFEEMFERRVAKGQYFHHPYFGCREFVADTLPVVNAIPSIQTTRDLGLMLWDIKYNKGRNEPMFFSAVLKEGILEVPVGL